MSIDSDSFHPLTPRQEGPPAADLVCLRKQQAEGTNVQRAVTDQKEEDHLTIQASIFKSLEGMLY